MVAKTLGTLPQCLKRCDWLIVASWPKTRYVQTAVPILNRFDGNFVVRAIFLMLNTRFPTLWEIV